MQFNCLSAKQIQMLILAAGYSLNCEFVLGWEVLYGCTQTLLQISLTGLCSQGFHLAQLYQIRVIANAIAIVLP